MSNEKDRRDHPDLPELLELVGCEVVAASFGPALAATIDRWHAAWSAEDPLERRALLAEVVTDDVTVEEPMASLSGLEDVLGWIAQLAAQLPAAVERDGAPALCAGSACWDWVIVGGSGAPPLARGRSVARLDDTGRFRSVTAFWLTAPRGFGTSLVDGRS